MHDKILDDLTGQLVVIDIDCAVWFRMMERSERMHFASKVVSRMHEGQTYDEAIADVAEYAIWKETY